MTIAAVAGGDVSELEAPLLDDVVRGSVDFKGLPARRSKSGCWKSAAFMIGAEVAERFAYYGISANLISYLTGPLGQSTAAAAANVNAWSGTALLLPLVGAFVADSYLGRYRTVVIASVVYILGLGFLTLSAALSSSHTSACEEKNGNASYCSPPVLEVVFFFFSLYLVALAQGGHKPCVQAFGADQFDEEDKKERIAKSSFFNWWYFSSAAGVFVAQLVLSYVQENMSWELGFGIPGVFMCLALILFVLGSMTYRFSTPSGERNPFVRIGLVFVKAVRNWKSAARNEEDEQIPHSFLDRAIVECSIHDVEEAKAVLRLIPIWCTCLAYAIVFAQAATLFTKQGNTMDRAITSTFEIPAASLQSIIHICVVILVPIYDRVLVPVARAVTKKPAGLTMLQRMGAGMFIYVVLMITAALVERKRLAVAEEAGLVDEADAVVPMSAWWLAPQYLLFGVGDVFTVIGLQEFFYDQVPADLKSIGLALYLSVFGVGNFLSSLLISVIDEATSRNGADSWFATNLNRGHIDYFYWLLAGVNALTLVAYLYFANSYVYKRKD